MAIAASLIACLSHANTEGPPPGFGQAGTWIVPCQLLDRQLKGETLTNTTEVRLAAFCEGAFAGIMAVNYASPPYLPFCEHDDDRLIDYVETFLAVMKANPSFATKQFGFVVLVALGRAHPKPECGG